MRIEVIYREEKIYLITSSVIHGQKVDTILNRIQLQQVVVITTIRSKNESGRWIPYQWPVTVQLKVNLQVKIIILYEIGSEMEPGSGLWFT